MRAASLNAPSPCASRLPTHTPLNNRNRSLITSSVGVISTWPRCLAASAARLQPSPHTTTHGTMAPSGPNAISSIETSCTVLFHTEKASAVQQEEIMRDLEHPDVKFKIRALKQTIMLLLSGENLPRVLMSVIRFCSSTDDHLLKKLLMMYWEVVPKFDGTTKKLLSEMILVCNALRNDLNHPNEFVRGSMLRFLCKLREPELLEPLVPSIKACLEHRHSYVRKNAALAVLNIHHNVSADLVPDAPELMHRFIQSETDSGARRNAFLFLCSEAEILAIQFLTEHLEDVPRYGDGFALLVLELTRKVCRKDPAQKARFVRALFNLLQSNSAAVSYEAAWTLVSLSSAPTAVRAAASTYAQLLNSQSDQNVKLIILERLSDLKQRHTRVVQEVLMDILRALGSPNVDICRKTLEVAMDLVSPRNIEEVVGVLKREVLRTQEGDQDKAAVYRGLLIQAIHTCAARFPEVADAVVHVLMDFLSGDGALDVIVFVRSIIEQYPIFRSSILGRLLGSFGSIHGNTVLGVAVWILGEYALEPALRTKAFDCILANAGQPPYVSKRVLGRDEGEGEGVGGQVPAQQLVTKSVVLSDGTYATQMAMVPREGGVVGMGGEEKNLTPLRRALLAGDVFLGGLLVSSLTKLTVRALETGGPLDDACKEMQAKTLLVACGVGGMAEVKAKGNVGAYADVLERVTVCARVLLDPESLLLVKETFLSKCKESYAAFLRFKQEEAAKTEKAKQMGKEGGKGGLSALPDALINFRQLRHFGVQTGDFDLYDGEDIQRATGAGNAKGEDGGEWGKKLSHVYQLSGLADPVYAEAYVTVHDYDIVLEILVINRTNTTLTNLTVELATMGDLKLIERPQSYTIGPQKERVIRANIKVSSTETGHIFGTIVYENSSTAEKGFVNLNDIQMDIMDYIRPASCSDESFRAMWAEFEWENKVAINTTITDLQAFLTHVVSSTNMQCLTPTSSLSGESAFLAANLYAKSVFGEDALVNLSVEKKDDADGRLSGYVRIRSKTQGIALSLGDRITAVQRVAGAGGGGSD